MFGMNINDLGKRAKNGQSKQNRQNQKLVCEHLFTLRALLNYGKSYPQSAPSAFQLLHQVAASLYLAYREPQHGARGHYIHGPSKVGGGDLILKRWDFWWVICWEDLGSWGIREVVHISSYKKRAVYGVDFCHGTLLLHGSPMPLWSS